MRMLSLYSVSLHALAIALLLCASAPVSADEGEQEAPVFTIEQVSATDSDRPEGWQPVVKAGVVPAAAPSVSGLLQLAREAKLDAALVSARARPLQKTDGTAGVVVVVGVDATSPAFTAALADAVVRGGWTVREMGSPSRVIVVWASSKDAAAELLNWQADLAVHKLCLLSALRYDAAGKDSFAGDREGAEAHYRRAIALAQTAAKMAPDSGVVNGLRVMLAPRSRMQAALPLMRKALDEKARIPAPLSWRARIAGNLGLVLLLEGTDEVLEEALRALEFAVKHEAEVTEPLDRFGARYNLACTLARLGKVDAAFEALEGSLKLGKADLGDQYEFHYVHCRDKDTDMDSLREDERFAALMKKYAPE